MNFIDLFSGIGGFRQGMEDAGHKCVGYVERDKFARKSYEAIYDTKGEWTRHDITEVKNEEWRELRGRVEVICAGFPCQAFSTAGKRGGFNDTRGTMFFEVARAAKEIQPQFLLLENVKGLLNHDKGRTFRTILSTLDELGFDAQWNVCNSKWFGLPQNRERTFIIASARTRSARKLLPVRRKDQSIVSNDMKVINNKDKIRETIGFESANRVYDTSGIAPTLVTMSGGGLEPKIAVIGNIRPNGKSQSGQVVSSEGISPCLCAGGLQKDPQKVAIPIQTPDKVKARGNGRRAKENNEEMFTLTTQDRHGVLVIDDQGRKEKKNNPSEVCPTLRAQDHGNPPKVLIKEGTKKGYVEAREGDSVNLGMPKSKTRRGRVGKQIANTLIANNDSGVVVSKKDVFKRETSDGWHLARNDKKKSSIQGTHVTNQTGQTHTLTSAHVPMTHENLKIRKLIPLECWRLQGFPDQSFYKAEKVVSNSQLYKQAGNSVSPVVVNAIAKAMWG